MKYNKKGVTLISLIITVIILLVLLGLTTVIIPNGLFKKSKNANENIEKDVSATQNEINGIIGEIPDIIDEGNGNQAPVIIRVEESNITATTATITVTATDSDEDSLTYKLVIRGKSGNNETGVFDITGLQAHTEYEYTVTVSDGQEEVSKTGKFTTENTAPTITNVQTSNIAATTASVTVTATDSDGDSLTYTLVINSKTYTTSDGKFSVTGLKAHTTYNYTVAVTDGTATATRTGNLTTKNNAPTITNVQTSNIATTTATVTVTASDADGDSLTYTLVINTKPYTTSDGKFSVTGLKAHTTYNYTATVTDGTATATRTGSLTTKNTSPTLSVTVSDATEKSVKITATGYDADGDTLKYTLTINGHTYGPETTNTWTERELSRNSSYNYTVTVTDGNGGTATKSGYASTLIGVCETCGGTGEIEVVDYVLCDVCGGTGKVPCSGSFEYEYETSDFACSSCLNDLNAGATDGFLTDNGWVNWSRYSCPVCSAFYNVCGRCGSEYSNGSWNSSTDHIDQQCPNYCSYQNYIDSIGTSGYRF